MQVIEFFEGKDLKAELAQVSRFPFDVVAKIASQLSSAVQFLHDLNIIHRDLSLENIFFDGANIKIWGFRYAKRLNRGKIASDYFGNPYYVSPEILLGKPVLKSDCWAIGVILYFLLQGRPPFFSTSKNILFQKILDEKPDYSNSHLAPAVSLLTKLFHKNPKKRIKAEQIATNSFTLFYNADDSCTLKKEFSEFWRRLELTPRLSEIDLAYRRLVASQILLNSAKEHKIRRFLENYKMALVLPDTVNAYKKRKNRTSALEITESELLQGVILLGEEISEQKVQSILERLGFTAITFADLAWIFWLGDCLTEELNLNMFARLSNNKKMLSGEVLREALVQMNPNVGIENEFLDLNFSREIDFREFSDEVKRRTIYFEGNQP